MQVYVGLEKAVGSEAQWLILRVAHDRGSPKESLDSCGVMWLHRTHAAINIPLVDGLGRIIDTCCFGRHEKTLPHVRDLPLSIRRPDTTSSSGMHTTHSCPTQSNWLTDFP